MKRFFYSALLMMFAMFTSNATAQEAEVLFEENFATSLGDFTTEGDDAWKWDEVSFVAKMIAINGAPNGAYLVSPEIDAATANTLSFRHAVSYCFVDDFGNRGHVYIRTIGGDWKMLEGVVYPADMMSGSVAADCTLDIPAEFNNQKVQIAFGYNSTGAMSNQESWYVNNVVFKGVKASEPEPEDPEVGETKELYNITFDSDANVHSWTVAGPMKDQYDFLMYNESMGGLQINGYIATEMTTEYVVSPVIKLANNNTVEFNHKELYYFTKPASELTGLVVRTVGGEWVEIEGITYEDTNSYYSTGALKVPSQFNNKEVEFGFKYMYDGSSNCGYWYIQDFKVMGAEGGAAPVEKKEAGIAYDKAEVAYTMGNDFEAPVFSNPNNLAVTFSSSDENVAIVAEDGTVSVLGEGTTTIKAVSAETEEFYAGEASYVLTVSAAQGGEGEEEVIFEESFRNGVGEFKEEVAAGSSVWKFASDFGGDIMAQVAEKTDSRMVSPEIELGSDNKVSFTYLAAGFTDLATQLTFSVKEINGEWTEIAFPVINVQGQPTDVEFALPEAFNNKKVNVGFRINTEAGVAAIHGLVIKGVKGTDTAIEGVENDVMNNNKIYDLQGRIVKNPSKGLYIINGKKVVIK